MRSAWCDSKSPPGRGLSGRGNRVQSRFYVAAVGTRAFRRNRAADDVVRNGQRVEELLIDPRAGTKPLLDDLNQPIMPTRGSQLPAQPLCPFFRQLFRFINFPADLGSRIGV